MNYIKELKAFTNWLLLNDLPTSAIVLWHTLMAINNMTGWKERFNAPNSTVEKLTGLSKQGLVDARKKLLEKGLIKYEKGKKGKAPIYEIVSLVNSLDQLPYQSHDQFTYQSTYQSHDQCLTIPKHKQNETKQKNKEEEDARAINAFQFYEQNGFGTISPYIAEKISMWIDDLSEELVLEAMKIAVENGARSWNYVETILRDWASKKLTTVEQVQAERLAYQQRKAQEKYPKKPIRQEIVPEWVHDTQTTVDEPQNIADFEEEKRKLLERIRKYKSG